MLKNYRRLAFVSMAIFGAGFTMGGTRVQLQTRVFEIRTYTANEGKLSDLHAPFRNHTLGLFEKHGMTNVGYRSPRDAPLSSNTLIYINSHESREAAKGNGTPSARTPMDEGAQESEVNGKLVAKVHSIFMDGTDYSPMR